jgi:hypothetical protein
MASQWHEGPGSYAEAHCPCHALGGGAFRRLLSQRQSFREWVLCPYPRAARELFALSVL